MIGKIADSTKHLTIKTYSDLPRCNIYASEILFT